MERGGGDEPNTVVVTHRRQSQRRSPGQPAASIRGVYGNVGTIVDAYDLMNCFNLTQIAETGVIPSTCC